MILDNIKNINTYKKIIPHFNEILDIINNINIEEKEKKLDFGFYKIQSGETNFIDTGYFESHEKYIDLQFLIKGNEVLEWEETDNLTIENPYDSKKDLILYNGKGNKINIKENMFYILFPNDGHKACGHILEKTSFIKMVMKIDISKL